MTHHVRPDPPSASWMPPNELTKDRFAFGRGKIVLGRAKGRTVAFDDNRHVVTVAGSRAGKSATSLMSNLLTWDGSAIVIDPKGELATNTAKWRAKLGQDVYILDPFGEVTGDAAKYRASFNPFDELRVSHSDDVVDSAAMIAEALIVQGERGADHWTMSAKNLIRGLCLYALHAKPQDASLRDLREILTSPLTEPPDGLSGSKIALERYFEYMLDAEDAFGGVVSGVGGSMLGKHEEERSAVISTGIEQTAFLDSPPMRRHLAARGLPSLRVLKHKPTTIFLVLPASKMATHFRWLRLVITQAMAALEGEKNKTGRDVLFVLEEFPTLGYMRQIEAAAGLMAGYNVKLWTVMQDLSQIQALYPKSWETFLGNAGIVEAFGNTDSVTLEYLSKRLGTTWAVQRQPENLNLPLRHIIELGNKPLGRRSWKLTTREMDVFAIPMDQIHALLIAYAAFGNYIGKRYPDHIPQDEFRGLLVWLRHHRYGPVDAIAPAKADVSEFCWLAETVFDLCPELALRYFQKRELNLASVQGLVS